MGNGTRESKSISEEIAELRVEVAEGRVEIKWTKWLAAAAFAASTLGQVTTFTPPHAVIDLIGRLL